MSASPQNDAATPMRVVWVAAGAGAGAGDFDEEYLNRVAARADQEGVQSVCRMCPGLPEIDAGAHLYGKGAFPACYTRWLAEQIDALRAGGVVAIRIDAGGAFPSLDHPINEANVIVATRYALHPARPLEEHFAQWLTERHGSADPRLMAVLARTFEVIRKMLWAGDQSLTSEGFFPTRERARELRIDSLGDRPDALAMARQLTADLKQAAAGLDSFSRRELLEHFKRLELLAECFGAFCRVMSAHRDQAASPSFAAESATLLALAEQVEALFGPRFFGNLPASMRDLVSGLAAEPTPAASAADQWPEDEMGRGER